MTFLDVFTGFSSFQRRGHTAHASTYHKDGLIGCDYIRHLISSEADKIDFMKSIVVCSFQWSLRQLPVAR